MGAHIFFLVLPSLVSSIWPPITCLTRHFLLKTRPINLAFLLFIICSLLLSSLSVRSESLFFTWWVQLIFPAFSSKIFQNFAGIYELLSEVSNFSSIQNYTPHLAFQWIFIYTSSIERLCQWLKIHCLISVCWVRDYLNFLWKIVIVSWYKIKLWRFSDGLSLGQKGHKWGQPVFDRRFEIQSRRIIHSAAMFCCVSFGKRFCGTVLPGNFVRQEICFFSGEKLTGP